MDLPDVAKLQGDLKHTRNRELRLERLQDSLKMLMEEKESKLNNTSINSRAVVERAGALRRRIEELESQLADQQEVGYFYIALDLMSEQLSLKYNHLLVPDTGLLKKNRNSSKEECMYRILKL